MLVQSCSVPWLVACFLACSSPKPETSPAPSAQPEAAMPDFSTMNSTGNLEKDIRLLTSHLNAIFATVESKLWVGMTTLEIDAVVEREMKRVGVESTYRQLEFPAHCTASVNNEVINTIPSERRLQDGDLLKLQIGIHGYGAYATQGWTFSVGTTSVADGTLALAGRKALDLAVAQTRAGTRVGDISSAIQAHIESAGYSINRKMVGNAIGRKPHQDPSIPGYGVAGRGKRLKKGTVLSIKVIAHAGGYEAKILDDGWNMVTTDGKDAVLFSHMVIVGGEGPTVITASH